MSGKRRRPAEAADASPMIDYRAKQDDAWYAVRLRLEGDILRVMYCNFSERYDEFYSAEAFAYDETLEEFRRRFRSSSPQLQDKDCAVVAKGMLVCASYRFAEDELRFYDATVESVNPSIHPLLGECLCKFEVLWQHGPQYGKRSILGIDHICLLNSQGPDANPTFKKFLDIVKEKLKTKDYYQSPCTSQIPSSTCGNQSKKGRILNSLHISTSNVEQTSKCTAGGRVSGENRLEIDVDMGGQSLCNYENSVKKRTYYFCRIDNLEKDLSPFTLMHFAQEHLGIASLAFVCPSSSHEFCTRGFILVEEKHQCDTLMDFLLSTEYFIVSLRGRPWVIDASWYGIIEGVMPTYEVKPCTRRAEPPFQIKLIHKGMAEYDKIKKLHSLHSEFLEHLHGLQCRLLADERKLLKQQSID